MIKLPMITDIPEGKTTYDDLLNKNFEGNSLTKKEPSLEDAIRHIPIPLTKEELFQKAAERIKSVVDDQVSSIMEKEVQVDDEPEKKLVNPEEDDHIVNLFIEKESDIELFNKQIGFHEEMWGFFDRWQQIRKHERQVTQAEFYDLVKLKQYLEYNKYINSRPRDFVVTYVPLEK